MKTIFGVFLLTIAFGTVALAQGDPPTTYSAPKADEIKEFVSDWSKFKADFAGKPETKRNAEAPGYAAYYLKRLGSNTSVTVNEFGGDTAKKKDMIYQYVKDSLTKLPQAKIVAETDFESGIYTGKEFAVTYDEGRIYARVRVLPVGKRIFEIKTDVVNWHMLTDDMKKDFETEAARFFGSFKLIEK